METAPRSLVIAGGGTGGHLIPGLAVATELRARGYAPIVFVGTARGIETRLVPAAEFELRLIEVGGLKNLSWRRRWATLTALPRAVMQSLHLLHDIRPAAVFGIGGYASGPVLLAAACLRIPAVVLEVNARTGLANRLAAPWLREAAVMFQETAADFKRASVTGIPVRREFFAIPPRTSGPGNKLLIFGGSQGARAINAAAVAAARQWAADGRAYRIVHQTGIADFDAVVELYRAAGLTAAPAADPRSPLLTGGSLSVRVSPFIEEMASAMAEGDLMVCRSGASTLGELAAAGRAALLIPFPGAADDHQTRNAEAFAAAGAAVWMRQAELSGASLAATVAELLANGSRLEEMEAGARRLAHPRAAEAIGEMIDRAASAARR